MTAMAKYHVSIPKGKKPAFNFHAFQQGEEEPPAAVPVALLERKVGAGVVERELAESVEVFGPDGKSQGTEIRRRRVQQRVGRQSLGRAVIRNVLEVEASSPAEAEAIYRKAVGINAEGTS